LERYPFVVAKAVLYELEKMTNNFTHDISLGMVIHPDMVEVQDRPQVPDPLYFELYFKTFYWSRADTIEVVNIKSISMDRFLDMVLDEKKISKILEQKVRNVL
jgi:hypothetical protein